MKIVKKFALVLVASAFVVGAVAGCEKKPADEVKDMKTDAKDAIKEAGK